MPHHVALLKGINVGKNNRIAMGDLRNLFDRTGFTGVRTHLNSGNVVFTTSELGNERLARVIEAEIASEFGMDVPVIVRSGAEMQHVVASNPFPQHEDDHKRLHVTFLAAMPDTDRVEALEHADKGEDDYRVIGTEVFLHYPNGVSGAVFMPNGLDRALDMPTTSRNWRTVARLAELASDL